MIEAGRLTRAGLVTTNSIRGGANREVLRPITERGRIFEAWSDEPWTVDGAGVRVSMVCFDGQKGGRTRLDGAEVAEVFADLTAHSADVSKALPLAENAALIFQGMKFVGDFPITSELARTWLAAPLTRTERAIPRS